LALQKAAFYSNGKIKPNVVIVGKDPKGKPVEQTHAEGKYVMNHKGAWLDAHTDALEAQRRRNTLLDLEELKRLRGPSSTPSPAVQPIFDRLTMAAAAEKYCRIARSGDFTPRPSAVLFFLIPESIHRWCAKFPISSNSTTARRYQPLKVE
jgi:hypothetical protein